MGTFKKVSRLDSERVIESSSPIFPGDGRRQFDHLFFVEALLESREICGVDFDRRIRHFGRVTQDRFIDLVEEGARFEIVKLAQFLVAEHVFVAAHGRHHVDSEGTTDHACDTRLSQILIPR